MSEPLGATRVKAPAKLARARVPHPAPLVGQRPARVSEIPPAAVRFGKAAVTAQWRVEAFYALGWSVDTGGLPTGKLRASVLLRMNRGAERASALWATPWPIPDGVTPPGLPPPILPADGHVNVVRVLRASLATPPAPPVDVTVKWAFEIGVYWVRPAPPLGVSGGEGRSGWWSMTQLREAVLAPASG